MLEPWIIEQIRRREEEERRRQERPQLEIPGEDEREQWRKRQQDEKRRDGDSDGDESDERPKRGVMIIDFG